MSDTGIGIAEHQRYIFDEFFQLSNPERPQQGHGAGARHLTSGWWTRWERLEVQSEPGKGSTFTVTLLTAGVPLQSAAR